MGSLPDTKKRRCDNHEQRVPKFLLIDPSAQLSWKHCVMRISLYCDITIHRLANCKL